MDDDPRVYDMTWRMHDKAVERGHMPTNEADAEVMMALLRGTARRVVEFADSVAIPLPQED